MKRLLVLVLMIGVSAASWSGELSGVTLPDSQQVDGESLLLNGMGLRKKAVIKVYVAGLYLPQKMDDAQAILGADTSRRLVMEFRFGVNAEKMCEAWKEGLEKNTPGASADLEARFETLCTYQEDMEKGQQMVYTYVPGKGTEVSMKGAVKGTIEGKDFADALFACWIGPSPPGEAFKKGLLGL